MFYYLYQITNLVNNKIYVGVHKTKDMDDGYMGSGKVIQMAIKKYGTGNFRKDILEIFQNAKSMYAREKELVTEEFLSRNDVYNIRRGGHGGFDYINKLGKNINGSQFHFHPERHRYASKKGGNASRDKKSGIFNPDNKHLIRSGFHSESQKIKMLEASLSKESREKRINTFRKNKHQQGRKNSQYGTMWITNGVESKKILRGSCIENEWYPGRRLTQ